MQTKFHGIEFFNDNETSGCFRHGLVCLLDFFCSSELQYKNKWLDGKASQATIKFKDTLVKSDRVASKFNNAVQILRNSPEPNHVNLLAPRYFAAQDVPIYLDSLLMYIRIQADCLSNLIPIFYGITGKKANIPRDSFRKQAKWFLETNKNYDPIYSEILRSNLAWFHTLSGTSRGQGLRDIIIHYRGNHQIRIKTDDDGDKFFSVATLNESGYLQNNTVDVLRKMYLQYYCFLDELFTHFLPIVRTSTGEQFWPLYLRDPKRSSEFYSFNHKLDSIWLYPIAKFRDSP